MATLQDLQKTSKRILDIHKEAKKLSNDLKKQTKEFIDANIGKVFKNKKGDLCKIKGIRDVCAADVNHTVVSVWAINHWEPSSESRKVASEMFHPTMESFGDLEWTEDEETINKLLEEYDRRLRHFYTITTDDFHNPVNSKDIFYEAIDTKNIKADYDNDTIYLTKYVRSDNDTMMIYCTTFSKKYKFLAWDVTYHKDINYDYYASTKTPCINCNLEKTFAEIEKLLNLN